MNKLLCLTMAFVLITSAIRAQSFRFRTNVDAVQQSGYQRILLPPDVVGHLNASLTDIRLYDDQQREIPYLLVRQSPRQTGQFVDYEIVSKQLRPRASTKLIVRNRAKNQINSLDLVLKNTNVGKTARLSGSADAQTWYAIDDDVWLDPTANKVTTTETQRIDFPLSDYEYYRLEINDSLSTPLNILRVGYELKTTKSGSYSPIPNLSFSQRDSSDRKTYIHLTRPTDARFDKLTIDIQASMPFRRRAEVGQFRTQKMKRGRINRWFEVVRSVEVSSSDSNVAYLSGLKTSDLCIVITNDDNQPLRVPDVRAYQLTTYLLTNLTAGSAYQLRFSADDVAAPAYDLAPFQPKLPQNMPIVSVGALTPTDTNSEQNASFFTDRRIIWPALGLVLLVLGVLSYRMIREMGKSNG